MKVYILWNKLYKSPPGVPMQIFGIYDSHESLKKDLDEDRISSFKNGIQFTYAISGHEVKSLVNE